MSVRRQVMCAASMAALVTSVAYPALANTADDGSKQPAQLPEIVVTAQKRQQLSQTIAAAITAYSAEDLQDRDIVSTDDLVNFTPGLQFYDSNGGGYIAVRGIGAEVNTSPAADPSVAFHIDGVYKARVQGVTASFFDIERIEVLRGPQGTLYGRNATGGSINVVTRTPEFDAVGGYVEASVGNYGALQSEAALNLPISDQAAFRISGIRSVHDGYTKNTARPGTSDDPNDEDSTYVRAQLTLLPSDTVSLTGRLNYGRREGNGPTQDVLTPYANPAITAPLGVVLAAGPPPVIGYGGAPNPLAPFVTSQDNPGLIDDTAWGASVTTEWELGWATATSIIALEREENFLSTDVDRSNVRAFNNALGYDNELKSLELRLASSGNDLEWIVGVFALQEDNSALSVTEVYAPNGALTVRSSLDNDVSVESYAAFAEINAPLTERLRLTVGLRYTVDDKTSAVDLLSLAGGVVPVGSASVREAEGWQATTGRVVLDYALTPTSSLYGSITRGYKSGGFGAGQIGAYRPEFVWAYEVGSKNRFFDNRVQLNASAFYYDQTDLQVALFGLNLVGQQALIIENAPGGKTLGLELEWAFIPFDGLTIDGNLSLLETEYEGYTSVDPFDMSGPYDLDGQTKTNSPSATLALGVQYRRDVAGVGAFTLRADGYWSDDMLTRAFARSFDQRDAYTSVGGLARWDLAAAPVKIEIFGRNLTNEAIQTSTFGARGEVVASYSAPRTFGLRVGYAF